MSAIIWFRLPESQVWHIVREDSDQMRTLCGLAVESVMELRDELGDNRPCDNCTEIQARHDDAGDQPAIQVAAGAATAVARAHDD